MNCGIACIGIAGTSSLPLPKPPLSTHVGLWHCLYRHCGYLKPLSTFIWYVSVILLITAHIADVCVNNIANHHQTLLMWYVSLILQTTIKIADVVCVVNVANHH